MDNVDIKRVDKTKEKVVKNLFQLYLYDLSVLSQSDVKSDGLFQEYGNVDECFTVDSNRDIYLISVDDNIAGFVMMDVYTIATPIGTNVLDIIFIMKKYRRKGIGTYVADYILNKYSKRLEIKATKEDITSTSFLNSLISKRKFKECRMIEINLNGKDWIVYDIVV